MSEKLKPNFTPVPNVILDEIMRTLNEGEFKTLMAICRKTYGWGKQSDQISLTQLAELTGLDRSNVARARKRLGALVEVIPGTATTASTYRLNIEIADTDFARIASDPSATSDRGTTSVKGSDPSATYKRKQKKEDTTGEFEKAWILYPERAGDNPKDKARRAFEARRREGVDSGEMIAGVKRYAVYIRAVGKEHTEYVKHAATFFGPKDKHWKEEWTVPQQQRSAGGFVG